MYVGSAGVGGAPYAEVLGYMYGKEYVCRKCRSGNVGSARPRINCLCVRTVSVCELSLSPLFVERLRYGIGLMMYE
jgi:hypothetical protein